MFFDKLRRELLDRLTPARCHWCGVGGSIPGCHECCAALPWNDHACRSCALPLATPGRDVCPECLRNAPSQDRTWAAFRYAAPVSGAIVALKFHGLLAPAHVLGTLMAERLARRPEPLPELLLPVPLHAGRLRRRGYNQALELARALGARLGVRILPGAAVRRRPTREQTRLDAAQRRRNVRGAFTIDPRVAGRHIALLDDVITTGATIAELARRARHAGAGRIEAWAVARAI